MKKIIFCGKQIKEDGYRTCGVTQIIDLTCNDTKNGLNSIYICSECLKLFFKEQEK